MIESIIKFEYKKPKVANICFLSKQSFLTFDNKNNTKVSNRHKTHRSWAFNNLINPNKTLGNPLIYSSALRR